MNMKQLAKLMAAGVLAMAAVPAISLAHTHRHVQAIAPSLSATTTTSLVSATKHPRARWFPAIMQAFRSPGRAIRH